MGEEQDEFYTARRAAFEQQFQELPAAGTALYWSKIEQPAEGAAIPPEVLSRCFRERWKAGKEQDAVRIFRVILLSAQPLVQSRAKQYVRQSPGGEALRLNEDIESEASIALWKELITDRPTFLVENFQHALRRIVQHAAHSVLEKEGLWKAPDVKQPTRIPAGQRKRIDAPTDREDPDAPAPDLADPGLMTPEDQEIILDLRNAIQQLDLDARMLLYWYFYCGYTQQEIADKLGVTDRTVRNRIENLVKTLRKYLGVEEEHHG